MITNNPYRFILLLLFVILPFFNCLHAQNDTIVSGEKSVNDTSNVHKHNPKLATIMSATLPGLGQVYNKKYWKVPIIYLAEGTLYIFANQNNKKYNLFLDGYLQIKNNDSLDFLIIDERPCDLDIAKSFKDQYRRSRDFMIIIMGFVYVLNIVDASVDAHFFDYDISEDLSIRLEPSLILEGQSHNTIGVKLNVYF